MSENSFTAPFPQGRKPDTINSDPSGPDDIMTDNWSFRDLSRARRQEGAKTAVDETDEGKREREREEEEGGN